MGMLEQEVNDFARRLELPGLNLQDEPVSLQIGDLGTLTLQYRS